MVAGSNCGSFRARLRLDDGLDDSDCIEADLVAQTW